MRDVQIIHCSKQSFERRCRAIVEIMSANNVNLTEILSDNTYIFSNGVAYRFEIQE